LAREPKLSLIPLGGLGEIGKNMTAVRFGENILVIDCGLAFPEEEMLGIDIVIPDMARRPYRCSALCIAPDERSGIRHQAHPGPFAR